MKTLYDVLSLPRIDDVDYIDCRHHLFLAKCLVKVQAKGKGFGTVENFHIYKDATGGMDESNLICYMVFEKKNKIKVGECNKSRFDSAEYFDELGIHHFTTYDLNNSNDIIKLQDLFRKIESI